MCARRCGTASVGFDVAPPQAGTIEPLRHRRRTMISSPSLVARANCPQNGTTNAHLPTFLRTVGLAANRSDCPAARGQALPTTANRSDCPASRGQSLPTGVGRRWAAASLPSAMTGAMWASLPTVGRPPTLPAARAICPQYGTTNAHLPTFLRTVGLAANRSDCPAARGQSLPTAVGPFVGWD